MSATRRDSQTVLRAAYDEIRSLRGRLAALEGAVAVIGAGCRLPGGVEDLEGLWTLLREGRDAVTEIPEARWPLADFYDPDADAPGRSSTR